MTTPDGTVVSDITGSTGTLITSTSNSSSLILGGSRRSRNRNRGSKPQVPTRVAIKNTFKGAHTKLSGKVFINGPTQAASYDEAYKAIIMYFGSKYDQRVYHAFEQKDANAGRKLLIKSTAQMIEKVVQIATEGENSKLIGMLKGVLDKDGEAFITYQMELKQYIGDIAK